MMKHIYKSIQIILFSLILVTSYGQEESSKMLDGLKFRSIGPAFMSGRIADIAIDSNNENIWYVAVGSGNVWKTINNGITWKALFENESVYSTGCITIDPNNSQTIWLGTGENVGGRHASWGDGVYKSEDGGHTWTNMGLKKSEHISEILIHPHNSNIIWVASQGPLWSKGGERGIYKSIDGGKSWKKTLGNGEWTGATEIIMDKNHPEVLYAATWDRHRTVAAYMGGGPGSGIHKSTDGGDTWTQLSNGIPKSNLGKIGICLSPQKSNVIYAAIETDLRTGGVYKSMDGGITWKKQSSAVSGATGPHYYQEIYACPHNYDRLYLMDNNAQISDDGGKTFRRMNEVDKHGDNHSINFKKNDPNYILMGTDGGIYETYDLCKNWRYIPNLPITQFYDIALDDAEPFYNVYGGTQDNSTEGGPSRTDNIHGIQNSDWRVVLNWDGHQPATEPGNPDIVYAQRQQGALSRVNVKTGEVIDIQPQPSDGEDYERFNWDAPILVSPHDPKQLFFGSQRVWRSNDRGDSWTAISEDLTRNENRFELPIMGRTQSIDNPWDVYAMSNYNTITMIDESPVQRDVIYVGTDDGLLHISENNGEEWTTLEADKISGVPKRSYINDIKADLFDANVAYMCLDNHKEGDYRPFIFKTSNKGKTWTSITSNLPNNTIIWRIVQDHVDPNLIFIGTEFGIYVTFNGGQKWTQMKGGLPTISFRDLKIHRRENDLVAASFGRSIYILDDIGPLRFMETNTNEEATLYPIRDTWWYIPRSDLSFNKGRGSQGSSHYIADNPPFGALITYSLSDDIKSLKEIRQEKEKENKGNISFPGWEKLDEEVNENISQYYVQILNDEGQEVNRIKLSNKKGNHRTAWNLRYPSIDMVSEGTNVEKRRGIMVVPGEYKAQIIKLENGQITPLGKSQSFNVKRMHDAQDGGSSLDMVESFWDRYANARKLNTALNGQINNLKKRLTKIEKAIHSTPGQLGALMKQYNQIKLETQDLDKMVFGNKSKRKPGQKTKPTIGDRLFRLSLSMDNSTYGPTDTNKKSLDIIESKMAEAKNKIKDINGNLSALISAISNSGGPYIEGEDWN